MIEGHDYTIYSNGPSGRARMYALLALITAFMTPIMQHGVLLVFRHYWGDDWDAAETALFFGGFTALIMFGILINFFNNYLWRTPFGRWMFRLAALPAPSDLAGEYQGRIEVRSAIGSTDESPTVFVTPHHMRIAQSWEQISILVERESESGGHVRVTSDLASLRMGMMTGVVTLRFVYTFEENLLRREGKGIMSRQFSGAATFEFQRKGEIWYVEGHFFDDIGRSGQVDLRQVIKGTLDADRIHEEKLTDGMGN